jgi:hypothetical protein
MTELLKIDNLGKRFVGFVALENIRRPCPRRLERASTHAPRARPHLPAAAAVREPQPAR